MARWSRMFLLVLLGACDRFQDSGKPLQDPEAEKAEARCRQECASTYRACVGDCKDDSPQVCESRCDLRQKKCVDACK